MINRKDEISVGLAGANCAVSGFSLRKKLCRVRQHHLYESLLMPSPSSSTTAAGTALRASTVVFGAGNWQTQFEALCARFPAIPAATWQQRILQGQVLDEARQPIQLTTPFRPGSRLYYFRAVSNERLVPFKEQILYQDDALLVVDKPPFLPVIPGGQFVTQTLQHRLVQQLSNPDLQPLHRLDRHTAGLVLFAVNKASRARYQALFAERAISKLYEAIAPPLPTLDFPYTRRSRIERDRRFFRSCEVPGVANAETRIEVIARSAERWLYRLQPVTGKKHQLRVHMAALGAPLENDAFYPQVDDALAEDYHRPLQLLARELRFTDPVTGQQHHFSSQQSLAW